MRAVNLIPYDVTLRDEMLQHLRTWLIVCGCVCLVVLGLFTAQKRVVSSIELQVQGLEQRSRALQKRYDEVKAVQRIQADLARKAGLVNALLAKRNFTRLFVELEQSMTPAVSLTYINVEKKHPAVMEEQEDEWVETGYFIVKKPGSKNRPQQTAAVLLPEAVVRGIALTHEDLAAFINNLERSALFHDVNLRYSRFSTRDADILEFELYMKLRRVS